MKYIAKHTVRTYECDSYGHVNNAVYLNYLEYARMEFLHAVGFDYNAVVAEGYSLYVTHIDIYYKMSAFLDDELSIEVYPTKQKHVTGTFHQRVTKADGTLVAEADVSWASVDKTGRPSKLPEKYIVPGMLPEDTTTA